MHPIQVAIYARVSSEQQAEAHTVASQVAALRERVAADGRTVSEAIRYYGVPRTMGRRRGLRAGIRRSWCQGLRRRSQRPRSPWPRIYALATQWLPPPHLLHPYPAQRWRVT